MSGAKRPTRAEVVEKMVADGWSREFAEAITPMTITEARAKGLRTLRYESAISQLNRPKP